MCQTVAVRGESLDPINTQGAFIEQILAGDAGLLVWAYGHDRIDVGACLCPLDVPASAAAAGWKVAGGLEESGCDWLVWRPTAVEVEADQGRRRLRARLRDALRRARYYGR